MKILITCFEPFGGSDVNPSERAAAALMAAPPEGVALASATLPCVDGACERALVDALRAHEPGAVLALGEHGRETGLAFERFAINLRDYRIPDNAGAQVQGEPVVEGGPEGYFSTLPVEAMVEACREAGVPARVSRDAGTFLCNQALYHLLHASATGTARCAGCFVHVPRLPEQVAGMETPGASMGTATVVRGLWAAAGVVRAWDEGGRG